LSFIFQPPGPGLSSGLGWPLGLATTQDGRRLVAALNQADQVAIVNLSTATRATTLVKVGTDPYGVGVDGAFVSNEYDGTISQVDLDSATVTRTMTVGTTNSHPEGLAVDGAHHRLYAAVTNRDAVAIVDTVTGAGRATSRSAAASESVPRRLPSPSPLASRRSFDGRTSCPKGSGSSLA